MEKCQLNINLIIAERLSIHFLPHILIITILKVAYRHIAYLVSHNVQMNFPIFCGTLISHVGLRSEILSLALPFNLFNKFLFGFGPD